MKALLWVLPIKDFYEICVNEFSKSHNVLSDAQKAEHHKIFAWAFENVRQHKSIADLFKVRKNNLHKL